MVEKNFEYEFSGKHFFYFIIPFGVFTFMMITCYLWPKSEESQTALHILEVAHIAAGYDTNQLLRVNASN